MIKIPIEILAVFIIFLIWLFWMVWYKLSLKKLKRRYKPEDDSSKEGEKARNEPRRDRGNEDKSFNTSRLTKPKRRSSVQKRNVDSAKKDSRSIRKPINPFRRRK